MHLPDISKLRQVQSKYYSHDEQVPNPAKSTLELQLGIADRRVDSAWSTYQSAVRIHNMNPTTFSLSRVNNTYDSYSYAVDSYNALVRRYNATPDTLTRPVHLDYRFSQGELEFGWSLEVQYSLDGMSAEVRAESVDRDFVRIGSKPTDVNASYRTEDRLEIPVSFDTLVSHLLDATDQIMARIAQESWRLVDPEYEANLDEDARRTVRWLLGPLRDPESVQMQDMEAWAVAAVHDLRSFGKTRQPQRMELKSISTPVHTSAPPSDWVGSYRESVVRIRSTDVDAVGSSSGAIISSDGLILTCAHCVSGRRLAVAPFGDSRGAEYEAEIVYVNPEADVALIRAIGFRSDTYLNVRLDEPTIVGERVAALGNPSFEADAILAGSTTFGTVASDETDYWGVSRIVADVTVASGSSGGPLISLEDGSIVGVIVAVAPAGLDQPGGRAASGYIALAAPAVKLGEWLGLY